MCPLAPHSSACRLSTLKIPLEKHTMPMRTNHLDVRVANHDCRDQRLRKSRVANPCSLAGAVVATRCMSILHVLKLLR